MLPDLTRCDPKNPLNAGLTSWARKKAARTPCTGEKFAGFAAETGLTAYNGRMEPELDVPEPDAASRFAALREESLELLDAAKSLVGEMRTALDHCKRHRPVVQSQATENAGKVLASVKTHRGGRVGKRQSRRNIRRPR